MMMTKRSAGYTRSEGSARHPMFDGFWSMTLLVDWRLGILTSGKVATLEEAKSRFRESLAKARGHDPSRETGMLPVCYRIRQYGAASRGMEQTGRGDLAPQNRDMSQQGGTEQNGESR